MIGCYQWLLGILQGLHLAVLGLPIATESIESDNTQHSSLHDADTKSKTKFQSRKKLKL